MALTAKESKKLLDITDKIASNFKEARDEMGQSGEWDKMDALAKAKVDALVRDVLETKRDADGNVESPSEAWKKAYFENKKVGFETKEVEDMKYVVNKDGWRTPITGMQSLLAVPTDDPKLKSIQILSDRVYMLSKMQGFVDGVDYRIAAKGLRIYDDLQQELSGYKKAIGTATSGEGADWIATEFSSEMVDEVRLQLMVAAQHRRIAMPSDPYTLPIKVGRSTAYKATEATLDAPSELRKSQLQTSAVTFSAQTIAVATPFSFEFEEDSIVPVLPIVREDIVLALAEAQENATINGDTATTHQDTGLTVDSDDQLKLWDGNRKMCLSAAKTDFNTGTEDFSTANIRNIRKSMGKYGVRPRDLAFEVSINAYIRMLGLSEVLTLDKYGSMATVVTGELGKLDNIPIVVSEFVRADMNASGIYDGTTVTKTIILLVHTPSLWYGDRRNVTVETVRLPLNQQNVMIATQRVDFEDVRPATTETIIGLGYDITS